MSKAKRTCSRPEIRGGLTTAKGSASSWRSHAGGGVKSVGLVRGRFFFPGAALLRAVEAPGHPSKRGMGSHCRTLCRICDGS